MSARLAEWCVWDRLKPLLADRPTAFHTGAKCASFNPVQSRLDSQELLLSGLAEFFQDFIVISLCGTITIIRIARRLEILLNRSQADL
jgi:hypothetical protein